MLLADYARRLKSRSRRFNNSYEWTRVSGVQVFGAPIYLHWPVLIVAAFMALMAISSPVFALLFFASYVVVIVIHEFGHACVAHLLGYEVDSIGISILHGWCRYETPDDEWHEVLVAWGGVFAQLLAALLALVIFLALKGGDWGYFTPIIVFLGYFNIVIVIINLLPGSDSDGAVAWRIVPLLLKRWRAN